MLETLGEDYVLTARAKGLSNWAIVRKHGLRNALLPIVDAGRPLARASSSAARSRSSTSSRTRASGSRRCEAIDQRDWPVLQAIFLLLTFSVILFNLVADLLYVKLDPRVVEA